MDKQEVLNYMENPVLNPALNPAINPLDPQLPYGLFAHGMLGHHLGGEMPPLPLANLQQQHLEQQQHQLLLEQQQHHQHHAQQQHPQLQLQEQPQNQQTLQHLSSQKDMSHTLETHNTLQSSAAATTTTTTITPMETSNPSSLNPSGLDTVDSSSCSSTTTTAADTQKRRNPVQTNENSLLAKKQHLAAQIREEEKKKSSLRKNIREVMDTNQLDTNTLKAQHEESERLARMAEQQKLLREYQQREAVLTHFDRFVNEHRVRDPSELLIAEKSKAAKAVHHHHHQHQQQQQSVKEELIEDEDDDEAEELDGEEEKKTSVSAPDESSDAKSPSEKEATTPAEVVTIEDSSDDDDCIVLSDDEGEEEEDDNDDPHNSGMHVKDELNVPDHLGRVVINVGHPEDEEDIFIAPQVARTIKPHQIGGVRFLFDNIIESTKRFKDSGGFGCILAHSMGLGKTLQVVCFCDIFLRYTPSTSVVCVMPINTLQNWQAEFDMWIPKISENHEYIRPRQFDVFVLNDQHKTLTARARVILQWKERGGVLLIGYELFRLLALKLSSAGKRRSKKKFDDNESRSPLMDDVYEALVKPGPDLIICDEGHRIKNAQAGISQALKQIRTRRRIVLTGYPLQNNLLEYWCMVDFVRPNYLGTRTEFCNMFERPIQNGLCFDSTPDDIKLMRYRAHVLHSLLVGFVQRRSHTVLQLSLPEKQEYVILTRMTELQKQLYDTFMNDIVRTKNVPNPLKAFAVCCKIWNHPDVLYDAMKAAETGMDMDIEGVDDATEALVPSINKNGFPPPVTPQQQLSLLQNGSGDATTPHNGQFLNQSTELQIQSTVAASSATTPTKLNNFQSPSLFSDLNQFETPLVNTATAATFTQEMQSPYFSYPSMMHTMGSPLKPNYVGCMLKQSAGANETINTEDSHNSSSEIVDLDTNEIKTIETDIDMDKNISLDKVSASDAGSVETCSVQNDVECKSETSSLFSSSIATTETNDSELKRGPEKITYDWALKFMKKYEPGLIVNSPKMEIFFCILDESVRIGDRVLLFSQSLLTLNLIEKFLQTTAMPGGETNWLYNKHYFRLDGSTASQEREKLVNEFNSNANVKLFLISTKAGSLGINLVGANRVIIFDASWNPCHDTQAIYRIYRYGQKRACYVYRIVMDKCLEKKIYDRQIKKQGMSDRVVDECNPDAHLSIKDVTNLCYDYNDDNEEKTANNNAGFVKPLDSYTDTIMKKILTEFKTNLTKEPFFHESLLVDRKSEKLSQAEKRQAHRSYEMQKKTSSKQAIYSTTGGRIQYQTVRKDGSLITRPVASVRPMQATRQPNQKNSSGLRSTRWIPAEVWQKQGMTAQEMSLPLDVVIPTNSSNKSKIIIKAGQRVMVLKSAKGIYMQLDSGKIIAIRTLNKPNVNTSDKSDVIDITGESETTTTTTNRDSKTEKSDAENTNAVTPKDLNTDASITATTTRPQTVESSPPDSTGTSQHVDAFNSSSTSVHKSATDMDSSKSRTILKTNVVADNHEQSTAHFQQRQQLAQQQSQQQQQQPNSQISHTQTLNEQQQQQQHNLQNAQQQITTTPQTSAQLMHSQSSPASYTQHQPYIYSQHQNPRSSQLYNSRGGGGAADISTTTYHQPAAGSATAAAAVAAGQYTDYQTTYGSHQQSARYHPTPSNSSHTDLTTAHTHTHPSHPVTHPPTSLSDFYGSYYPQWSSFMLTSPSQSQENPHLIHNASTYPPIAPPSTHSHSHHAKVQPNTHQWQHYHP